MNVCSLTLMTCLSSFGLLYGSGLPPLPSTPSDYNYGSSYTENSYTLQTGVTVSGSTPFFFGTPVDPAHPRTINLQDFGDLDSCYGSGCSSTSIPVVLGTFQFLAGALVPDTGIQSESWTVTVGGALTHGYPGSGLSFAVINASGTPTLFTGDDPGGLSSYVYFENADGTFSDVLHVDENTDGLPYLNAVVLDPPAGPVVDIVGFANLSNNEFLTPAPTPEPAAGGLILLGAALLATFRFGRRA